MGQVAINGTILGGPVSPGAGFPQAIFTAVLATTPSPKPFSAASGVLTRRVNQAAPGFLTLSGVGPADAVVRGDTFYLRSDSQLLLRLSQTDPLNPSGPALVRDVYVSGLCIIEFPASSPLVLLEAQGSATIEYLITGQLEETPCPRPSNRV
jgi:hypothetical protein